MAGTCHPGLSGGGRHRANRAGLRCSPGHCQRSPRQRDEPLGRPDAAGEATRRPPAKPRVASTPSVRGNPCLRAHEVPQRGAGLLSRRSAARSGWGADDGRARRARCGLLLGRREPDDGVRSLLRRAQDGSHDSSAAGSRSHPGWRPSRGASRPPSPPGERASPPRAPRGQPACAWCGRRRSHRVLTVLVLQVVDRESLAVHPTRRDNDHPAPAQDVGQPERHQVQAQHGSPASVVSLRRESAIGRHHAGVVHEGMQGGDAAGERGAELLDGVEVAHVADFGADPAPGCSWTSCAAARSTARRCGRAGGPPRRTGPARGSRPRPPLAPVTTTCLPCSACVGASGATTAVGATDRSWRYPAPPTCPSASRQIPLRRRAWDHRRQPQPGARVHGDVPGTGRELGLWTRATPTSPGWCGRRGC